MAINTSALNSTLQSRVDALDAATDTKEVLLLSKALEAAAGSTSVSDVLSEGVVQVNNVNSEGSAQIANVQNEGATQRASVGAVLGDYTPTTGFKTVGGQSVVGSGDIATLPSQSGASGKVLKSDGTNAAWGTDEGGKLVGMATYDWGTRYSPANTSGWNDWYTNTYNKQSSTSTLVFNISISSSGEYSGVPQHYWRFGNTNSTVITSNYGVSTHINHNSHTLVITGNTQTGSQSWAFAGDYKGYGIVNPNTSDWADIEQSHTLMTIMEVEV